MKESILLARATSAHAEARLIRLAQARQGLVAVADAFKEAGIATGVILFSECFDNLYALNATVRQAGEGRTADELKQAISDSVDLRDFADDLTKAGHGEFFALTIDFARFREEYIEPLERELRAAGVDLDV